jgi:hypothetical protein
MNRLVLVVLISFACGALCLARADHVDPEVKTQVNKQTTFFKDNIENIGQLEKDINSAVDNAAKSELNEDNIMKNMQETMGISKSQIDKEKDGLDNLHPDDLSEQGRKKMLESNITEEIYPDENSALMKQHAKDVDFLVGQHKKLLGNLLDVLKQNGLHVDCKQIKGNKIIEPGYSLKTERIPAQDSTYDQKICEEPRNSYKCRDVVTLKCNKREKVYGDWQLKETFISGSELFNNHKGWLYSIKWKDKRFGVHMHDGLGYRAEVAYKIAGMLGVSTSQIIVHPIEARGYGGELEFGKDIVWEKYRFVYSYRDYIGEKCLEWQEDWNESCYLR